MSRRRRHAELRAAVRYEGDVLAARITDRLADLTEPIVEQVTQEVWVVPYRRPRLRVQTLELPSLLDQLAQMQRPTGVGRASSSGSSVPVHLAAIDTLRRIGRQSRQRVERLGGPADLMVRGRLVWLARTAPTLELADLTLLDEEVLSWWASARVDAAWVDPPWRPHVPCTVCSRVGTLRVQLSPLSATCVECHASWDASTIGIMGHHVQQALEERKEARRRARLGLDADLEGDA